MLKKKNKKCCSKNKCLSK